MRVYIDIPEYDGNALDVIIDRNTSKYHVTYSDSGMVITMNRELLHDIAWTWGNK